MLKQEIETNTIQFILSHDEIKKVLNDYFLNRGYIPASISLDEVTPWEFKAVVSLDTKSRTHSVDTGKVEELLRNYIKWIPPIKEVKV